MSSREIHRTSFYDCYLICTYEYNYSPFQYSIVQHFMSCSAPGSREMLEKIATLDKLYDNRVVAPGEAALDAAATLRCATLLEEQVRQLLEEYAIFNFPTLSLPTAKLFSFANRRSE